MNKNNNIALIGFGNWGKNIARNLSQMGALACIYDHDHTISKKITNEFKLPYFTFGEILSNKNIKAIIIASTAETHKDLAVEALLSDKDVLIEKPFCLSLSDAKKISKLAEEKKKILMVGHLLNYHNAFIKMKSLIEEGKIGSIKNTNSTV